MLHVSSESTLNDLKEMLKREVKEITLNDLQQLSLYFSEETRYLKEDYKSKYVRSVQNVHINRFKSLKNNEIIYEGKVSEKDAEDINNLLSENDDKNVHLLNILAIYTTYILKKPIHPIETVFPGSVKIYKNGNSYYCPIKKYHINNNKSLCKICIAKMVED